MVRGLNRTIKKISKVRRMKGGVSNIPRSVMGKLFPPVNITSDKQLPELDKRISEGPVTLVFIYAPWCGHCKDIEPTMDELEAKPNRTVQVARVRDDMFPKSSIANHKLDGYPTFMLFKNGQPVKFKDSEGNMTNSIPNYKDKATMEVIMTKMGTPSGINILENEPQPLSNKNINSLNNIQNNTKPFNKSVNNTNDEFTNNIVNDDELSNNQIMNNNTNNIISNNNEIANNQIMNNNTNNTNSTVNNIPKNIVADRAFSAQRISELNNQLRNSSNANIQNTVREGQKSQERPQLIVQGGGQGGEQQGGGLFASLSAVANNLSPAAALFLGTQVLKKGTRKQRVPKKKMTRKA